jgi:cell wall hydrolase|nr:MAG TPA: Cell Wall Hydrolase [Caudoviricetes sp.]
MTNVNALSQKVGDFIRFRDNKDIIFRTVLIILLSIADGAMIYKKCTEEKQEQQQTQISNAFNNDYTQIRSSFDLDVSDVNVENIPATRSIYLNELAKLSEPINSIIVQTASDNKNDTTTEPVTLYDTLSENEIAMIEITIQHEVGNFSKEYKTYVAELIRNRLISEDFPNTVTEVLFQKSQFQGISNWLYSGITPDEETKEVVKEVFSAEGTSHSATYYYNPELSEYDSLVWFEYSGDVEYVFEYSETNWGTTYTTRFFV